MFALGLEGGRESSPDTPRTASQPWASASQPRWSSSPPTKPHLRHRSHGEFEDLLPIHRQVGIGALPGRAAVGERLDAVCALEQAVEVLLAAAVAVHGVAQHRAVARVRLDHHCAAAVAEQDARACAETAARALNPKQDARAYGETPPTTQTEAQRTQHAETQGRLPLCSRNGGCNPQQHEAWARLYAHTLTSGHCCCAAIVRAVDRPDTTPDTQKP
jgi:hypothetical protein